MNYLVRAKRANERELWFKSFRERISKKHNFCDQHKLEKCSWQFTMNFHVRAKRANEHELCYKSFREMISNKRYFCNQHELFYKSFRE